MNQNQGEMQMPDPKAFEEITSKMRGQLDTLQAKIPRGNPDRKGSALTVAESNSTEIKINGWPTLELYERVQIKGVWFKVTRMKPGSGNIGLQMLTTVQAEEEGRKVIRPIAGDVIKAIEGK